MKKILFFLGCYLCCLPYGFAIDCADGMDEKLIKIDATKIDTTLYSKKIKHNEIERLAYKNMDSYAGGRWSSQNEKDTNLNVSGVAICVDSDVNVNIKNINVGPYCWCALRSIDNFDVSSNWTYAHEYSSHKFDDDEYADKPDKAAKKEKEAKDKNIQDCLKRCAESCQSHQASMIHKINGFYKCDKSLYKSMDARCVLDNKFIHAKYISIFDDVAEVRLAGGGSIVFTREPDDKNNFDYVGKYDGDAVYLRWKKNSIYIGRKIYSLQECN